MHQTVASTSSTALLSRRIMSGEKILSPAAASCGLAGCLAASETKDEESWCMLSREDSSSPLELADIFGPPPSSASLRVLWFEGSWVLFVHTKAHGGAGKAWTLKSGPRPEAAWLRW
jgi:hypothetical protein